MGSGNAGLSRRTLSVRGRVAHDGNRVGVGEGLAGNILLTIRRHKELGEGRYGGRGRGVRARNRSSGNLVMLDCSLLTICNEIYLIDSHKISRSDLPESVGRS